MLAITAYLLLGIIGVPVFAVIFAAVKTHIEKKLIDKKLPLETYKYTDVYAHICRDKCIEPRKYINDFKCLFPYKNSIKDNKQEGFHTIENLNLSYEHVLFNKLYLGITDDCNLRWDINNTISNLFQFIYKRSYVFNSDAK